MATAGNAASARELSQKEADIQMMLAAEVHLGTKNCNFQMERYVFKRRNDGMPFFFCVVALDKRSVSLLSFFFWYIDVIEKQATKELVHMIRKVEVDK